MNHATWVNNPKYLIKFDKKLMGGGNYDVEFVLTQAEKKPCFVGFYLFGGYKDGIELSKNNLIKQTTCINKVEINLEVRLPASGGEYVIMPTCFTTDEKNEFELRINTKEKISLAELSGTNGRLQAKNLGDTVKKPEASVKKAVKSSEDPGGQGVHGGQGGAVDMDELSEAKRGVTVSNKGNSSKTSNYDDYDDHRSEKPHEEKPKFGLFTFGGEKDKEKEKEKEKEPKPPKEPKSPKPAKQPKSAPPKMKKSKSSSDLVSPSKSAKPASAQPKPTPAPKQPKPSWTGGGGGGVGGGGSVSLHNNNKGDVLLSFGKGGGTKTKKSTKTVVGPDGKKTKQTVVTTTRYYCGGCGETVSGKQCGNCGAKLKQ